MMKKTVVLMIALLMISAVGFAAPMTDFSAGKWQVDAMMRSNLDLDAQDRTRGEELETDGVPMAKTNWDFQLTAGLGNNWAVQYKNVRNDANKFYVSNYDDQLKMRSQELNFLYKIDENSAAFVGVTRSKYDIQYVNGGADSGKNTTGYQVGLQTTVPISKKVDGYAIASVGNKATSFEIGMAYKASANVDVNISYVDRKYKNLPNDEWYTGSRADITAKGVGIGVSYRF